jgi:hypothetical protein
MALKDIVSQKDLIAEANRTRQKRVEEGNKARAEQKEEARKANYLRRRREGNNIAYQQFKRSGTEAIDTGEDQGAIDKFIFGEVKNDPKYQAAREMKSALEHERARAGLTSSDQQKELKDLYETGISDKDIAAAKGNKKGGAIKVKKMAKGGKVSQLAKANGCAVRGKTRGKIC